MAVRTFESVFQDHPSVVIRVGWDRSRYLQLGRATWKFRRLPEGIHAVYRNLLQEQDYSLGWVSSELTEGQMLKVIAEHHESHTPGDWVIVEDKIFSMTIERGVA